VISFVRCWSRRYCEFCEFAGGKPDLTRLHGATPWLFDRGRPAAGLSPDATPISVEWPPLVLTGRCPNAWLELRPTGDRLKN
jgi:hypothetical protein